MKKFSLLLLFTLFNAALIFGQSQVKITGKIIDAETKTPLEYATVSFQKENDTIIKGTTSNKKGLFNISITSGTYNVKVSFISFKTYSIDAKELLKTQSLGSIALQPDNTLDEVEVTAEKKLTEVKFNKVIYNASSDAANAGGTGIDVLNNTPSVRLEDEKVIVRGGNATVLIDGKPQFSLTNTLDVLKSIPSNTVDKVEIITRDATYSASTGGAIINIITKKRLGKGFNGSIEAHTGLPDNHGISTFLNLDKDKVNLYSTISYNYSDNYKDADYAQPTLGLTSNNRTDRITNGILFNLGSDFYVGKKDVITASFLTNLKSKNHFTNNIADAFTRSSFDNGDDTRLEGNLGYKHNFNKKGHKVSADFKYETLTSENLDNITERQTSNTIFQKSAKNQNLDSWLARIDYTLPVSKKAVIKFGYNGTSRVYDNTFKVEELNNSTNIFEVINTLDNTIKYDEKIHAFYTQYKGSIKSVTYSLGLRTEITDVGIKDQLNNINKPKNYTHLFPSITVGYPFGKSSYLSFSYIKSIERPSILEIAPFLGFTDQRFQGQGNLNLNPFLENDAQILFDTRFNKFNFTAVAYGSYNKNHFLRVYEDTGDITSNGNAIFRYTTINSGTKTIFGLDANLTYRPSKNALFNLNISPSQHKITDAINPSYNNTNNIMYATGTMMLTSNNGFKLGIQQFYQSPIKNGLREQSALQFTNITLSKSFLKKKAVIAFRAKDIFATKKAETISYESNTKTFRNVFYENQYLLSFTYRFNQKRKSSKDRSNEIKEDKLDSDIDKKQ